MVYTWYIQGFLDITSFLKPDFVAGLCCWSHCNAHTCVCDQEYFIPYTTMAIVPGEKGDHKRLNPTAANLPSLLLAAAVMAAAAVVLGCLSVFQVFSLATT